jgi:hypothetical protein
MGIKLHRGFESRPLRHSTYVRTPAPKIGVGVVLGAPGLSLGHLAPLPAYCLHAWQEPYDARADIAPQPLNGDAISAPLVVADVPHGPLRPSLPQRPAAHPRNPQPNEPRRVFGSIKRPRRAADDAARPAGFAQALSAAAATTTRNQSVRYADSSIHRGHPPRASSSRIDRSDTTVGSDIRSEPETRRCARVNRLPSAHPRRENGACAMAQQPGALPIDSNHWDASGWGTSSRAGHGTRHPLCKGLPLVKGVQQTWGLRWLTSPFYR